MESILFIFSVITELQWLPLFQIVIYTLVLVDITGTKIIFVFLAASLHYLYLNFENSFCFEIL